MGSVAYAPGTCAIAMGRRCIWAPSRSSVPGAFGCSGVATATTRPRLTWARDQCGDRELQATDVRQEAVCGVQDAQSAQPVVPVIRGGVIACAWRRRAMS